MPVFSPVLRRNDCLFYGCCISATKRSIGVPTTYSVINGPDEVVEFHDRCSSVGHSIGSVLLSELLLTSESRPTPRTAGHQVRWETGNRQLAIASLLSR